MTTGGDLRQRPYAPADAAGLAALLNALEEHVGFSPSSTPTFLPELCVLAFDGDELAGYLVPHRAVEPGGVNIGHLGVRKPWRRRELASGMLTIPRATAADTGWRSIRLQADAENAHDAVAVYEQVGFTATTRSVAYELTVEKSRDV